MRAGAATLLVLADGRLPSGGHAHSGGLEAAVTAGRVHDVDSLAGFLRGRLATTGVVTGAFAAAACAAVTGATGVRPAESGARTHRLSELDAGLDARTPSPALRRASRAQGRALLRAGRAMWPGLPAGLPTAPHHPVALGAVAATAGLGPTDAAVAAAYAGVSGPAGAAVRLLGLDPYRVHALLAGLADECDRIAAHAATLIDEPADALPAAGAPLLDVGAELHATWEVRLFAS